MFFSLFFPFLSFSFLFFSFSFLLFSFLLFFSSFFFLSFSLGSWSIFSMTSAVIGLAVRLKTLIKKEATQRLLVDVNSIGGQELPY